MALENKLNITDSAELAREEERISKKKAVELFDSKLIDTFKVGTFAGLAAIHKYLFEDIYDFAGKMRTVNIAKGNFRFAPLIYLEAALANIDEMPRMEKQKQGQAESHSSYLSLLPVPASRNRRLRKFC